MTDFEEMVNSYLETALWSSTDGENPLDDAYDISDFESEERSAAELDCSMFVAIAEDLLDGLELSQVGHDFWLTRNGHGAGFWDGDYEKKLGEKLTEISKRFTEVDPYVGDDGQIYFMGGGLR